MDPSAGDWQIPRRSVKERLHHLLETGLWSDSIFLVGPEAETVKAHSFVLAMSSPVFETMFFGPWAQDRPIPVPDIHPEAFKDLLRYIYTDKISPSSFHNACDLYYASRKYMFPLVTEQCALYMERNVTAATACCAYQLADMFDDDTLKDVCLKVITTQTKDVLKDPSVMDTDLHTLETIFAQEHLAIDSELELFDALMKWVGVNTDGGRKRGGSPEPGSDESPSKRRKIDNNNMGENDNSRESRDICVYEINKDGPIQDAIAISIRKCLSKVRLLTLTVDELAHGPLSSGLLPAGEALALLMTASGAPTPLHGLSDSRQQRRAQLSTTTEQSSEVELHFMVPNFRTRKRPVGSGAFHCRGLEWQFEVIPGPFLEGRPRQLGIAVKCYGKTAKLCQEWQCRADVSVTVTNQTFNREKNTFNRKYQWDFDRSHDCRQVPDFMAWDVACSAYLVSNTFTALVRITVQAAATKPAEPAV